VTADGCAGMAETKKCSKCKKIKSIGEYWHLSCAKDGLRTVCKDCLRTQNKEWSQRNAAHRNARQVQRYWKLHEYILEYHRKWHAANRKKENARQKKYYEANREKEIKRCSEYKSKHRLETNILHRKWMDNNPYKNAEYGNRRRTTIKKNGGDFTSLEWSALCDKYNNACLCCGATDKKLVVDHVLPISLGGRNSIDNLQPLCTSCNARKHAKHIDYRIEHG
jgi:5-methylcytosine-specific restriction endonuclease McrA